MIASPIMSSGTLTVAEVERIARRIRRLVEAAVDRLETELRDASR